MKLNDLDRRMLTALLVTDEFRAEDLAHRFDVSPDTVWRLKRSLKREGQSIVRSHEALTRFLED